VDSDLLEVHWGAQLLARHTLRPGAAGPVWGPAHHAAAEAIALGRSRPQLRVVPPPAQPERPVGRLALGDGDYDVDAPDLEGRYGGCGCTGRGA